MSDEPTGQLAKVVPLNAGPDPVPFATGTYALYETPEGGVHLVVREKSGEQHHIEAPAFMVRALIESEGHLSPHAIVKAMMGGRKARKAGRE